ncbi:hypothetical protein NQ176_g10443 [Zarea fungicola]|uniref:Uncharacterized protein n=1 Tax=Zarea fungicola TaxID=93591 RepID=A0ACC1MGK7_9HYPO|nr:hypothetical protein NQ176_g10443 [Lecanicillium fungicola]
MATQHTSASASVEILVHGTAPSKVADDVTYRHLAQSYLSFAPGSRVNVTISSSPSVQHQPAPPSRQDQEDHVHNLTMLQSFCSDSQDISFRSALDNRSSPLMSSKKTRQPATPPAQLPSQIPDSYPMPDADLFNVTPTRVLQRYIGSRLPRSTPTAHRQDIVSFSPLSAQREIEAQTVPNEIGTKLNVVTAPVAAHIISFVPPSQSRLVEEQSLRREATIPLTPLVPEATRKRKADHMNVHLDDTFALDITHISSSITSTASSVAAATALQRSESDPLSLKQLRENTAEDDAGAHHNLVRSVSDPNHQHQRRCQQQQLPLPPPSSQLAYTALSQVPSTYLPSASSSPASSFLSSHSIRPPSPPTGVSNLALANLVSAKLAKLAHDLSSRYRPILHRALNPLERGYWLVDCTTWPADTRTDAWAFLKSYVGSGLAGWGVWCKRSSGDICDGSGEVEKHASIRLYGWAHVVKHTYLLLYLVSGRQLKITGAKWYDADGKVAVEVVP